LGFERERTKFSRTKEEAGVNLLGGLSTIALRGMLVTEWQLTLDLMVDLEIRREIRLRTNEFEVLDDELVTETLWAGQSQFSLPDASDEYVSWVSHLDVSGLQAFRFAIIASFYGYRDLGNAWLGQLRPCSHKLGSVVGGVSVGSGRLWRRITELIG